ncbi:MAG: spore coat protein CotJB [Clostridia bacterium]|nr:spore coat protein CotJB [Clostridia bacterium]MBQ1555374.1 spore coat protein CotJB [Clostridia bacterium]MBQ4397544.1 spore coat protein CotJB [Clostridia bacterium]
MNQMDKRQKLLAQLSACQFAQYELMLFLDTHPDCTAAMKVLQLHRANAQKLREQYECQFGPLSNPKGNGQHWNWIDDPWPWDYTGAGGCFTPSMGARNKKGACR